MLIILLYIYLLSILISVLLGLFFGFLGSREINEEIISWKFIEDLLSLFIFIFSIGIFWPLITLFLCFILLKYFILLHIYSY